MASVLHRARVTAAGRRTATFCAILDFALLAAAPAQAGFPSPADWRDQVIYQIVTDRFYNGSAANDAVEGNYDAANGFKIHGGDLAGIEQKLDYLQTLGVTSLWISPVPLNAYAEYHGYAARDFQSVAPHWGGLAALQSLVQACHARGMYVILDVVCNHTGDLIGSSSAGYPTYQNPSSYTLNFWNNARKQTAPFNNLSWYHNNGNIGTYTDPQQILGELVGLDDLKTELPAVRDALANAFIWLIQQTDCDGFRVDTVKHVEMGFWQDWVPRIRAYAATQGKNDLLVFGECFDGSDSKVGSYTGTLAGGAYAFDSMLYYPMYYTTNDVFVFDQPTSAVAGRHAALTSYDATTRERLVRFLDNHDNPRFLSASFANQSEARMRAALVFHLTWQGIPCVYYGTEQAFDGGADPYCREDMFDGQWDYGPSTGDNFDEASPLFTHLQKLNALRRAYAPLRSGTLALRRTSAAAGILAYSRLSGGREILVVLNTSGSTQSAVDVPTSWASGTPVVNLLDETQTWTVEPAGTVDVTLGARGSALIIPALEAVVLPPTVSATFPRHDAVMPWPDGPLRITFSRAMHPASVAPRLHITPAVAGSFSWFGNTLEFRPNAGWTPGQLYNVGIEPGAHDAVSPALALALPFEMRFRGPASGSAVTVGAAGYLAQTWSAAGLSAPEGLEFAGGAFGDFAYVGDQGMRAVLGLDAGGGAAARTNATTLMKPEGLVWDAAGSYGGGILIADQNGVYKMAAAGTLTAFLPASSESGTGWIGIAPPGGFGGRMHMGSNSQNWIRSYTAAGSPATLTTNVNGFEAAAFGPGGAWGSDLYVADPDLRTFSADINGTGTILRISSAGVKTTFAASGTLTQGIAALAFDPVGLFGGDLFGADVALERIVRITPAGAVSVFATGFGNLFGSDCLAFSPNGDLYVVDTGSGQPFTDTSGGTAAPRIVRIRPATPSGGEVQTPTAVRLHPGVPNPFNPTTTLSFELPRPGPARLEVFDVTGRRVRRLLDAGRPAGLHRVQWDGREDGGNDLASGVYIVRLRAGAVTRTTRVTLVR